METPLDQMQPARRLAGAPISWGVCEVPGWGHQLEPTRVLAGDLSLMEATQQGLFRPLGQGDARIHEVLRALDEVGYERWLVLEQDTAIAGPEPPVGGGPVLDVKTSIEYLTTRAPDRREVAEL